MIHVNCQWVMKTQNSNLLKPNSYLSEFCQWVREVEVQRSYLECCILAMSK